jgi:hypothetical protein
MGRRAGKSLLAGSEVRAERAADSAELAKLAEAVSAAEAELDAFMLDLANRAEHMPAVRAAGAYRRQWLAGIEQGLAQGWDGNVQQMRHAIALALDFRNWQTLVRKRGLSTRQAIRIMLAMVGGAACKQRSTRSSSATLGSTQTPPPDGG